MRAFMDQDFLLETEAAKHLYHDYAAACPIFDYHCHLSPREIYEDKRFSDITELWLGGDHYKWRFMRSMGVEEKFITGDAPSYEKFLAYARCLQYALGNPLYHWSHLELSRYFGITEPLTEENASRIYQETNEKISSPDFSARSLIQKSNVVFVGTTDDPADSLCYHKKLREEKFPVTVAPTFRPDKALAVNQEGFSAYVSVLSEQAEIPIRNYADLKQALSLRMDAFDALGCCSSDHSISPVLFVERTGAESVFSAAMAEKEISEESLAVYRSDLLLFLGKEYARRGWVMQLHLSALRNNNTRYFKALGPDTGFDSIDDGIIARPLSRFLDALDREDALPKTILYSLNPKDNYVLGTMLGNFQRSIPGKLQLGSAWWFNDHIDGMREQIKALGNLGALAAFVGMLTDSRSLVSYPRHEYFRRILCNIIGSWVEKGEFANNETILKKLISGICYQNAANFFKA